MAERFIGYGNTRKESLRDVDIIPPIMYFAIYYDDHEKAFERAASTWKSEVEKRSTYRKKKDKILLYRIKTESSFTEIWNYIYDLSKRMPVKEGQLLVHASYDNDPKTKDGLEFKADTINDGTLTKQEIGLLPKLYWIKNEGVLYITGCNTSIARDNPPWSPAEEFCKSQGVTTVGQSGYAYFSKVKSKYIRIDNTSQDVYLWAFMRGKNGILGNGSKIDGHTFLFK
jgi:hypothetical protein